MFLYCVGFRLFRDVCTDIAGGFSAVGRYISDRIEIHFPHNADTIALHIRNLLKCLISKDTQFFLFEWDSLFFWGKLHVSRVSHGFLDSCFLGSGDLVLLSRVEKWEGVERVFGQWAVWYWWGFFSALVLLVL